MARRSEGERCNSCSTSSANACGVLATRDAGIAAAGSPPATAPVITIGKSGRDGFERLVLHAARDVQAARCRPPSPTTTRERPARGR